MPLTQHTDPFAQARAEREAQLAVSRVGRALAEQILMPEIIRYASAANLPEKFIRGLEIREVVRGDEITYEIFNTWTNEFGLPLAEWFDKGTANNYLIEPKATHDDIGLSAPSQGAPIQSYFATDPDTQFTDRDRARIEHNKTGYSVQHPSVLYWERYGEKHWRRTVIHPGQPPTNAIERGLNAAKQRFAEALAYATSRAMERTAPGAILDVEAEVVVH